MFTPSEAAGYDRWKTASPYDEADEDRCDTPDCEGLGRLVKISRFRSAHLCKDCEADAADALERDE